MVSQPVQEPVKSTGAGFSAASAASTFDDAQPPLPPRPLSRETREPPAYTQQAPPQAPPQQAGQYPPQQPGQYPPQQPYIPQPYIPQDYVQQPAYQPYPQNQSQQNPQNLQPQQFAPPPTQPVSWGNSMPPSANQQQPAAPSSSSSASASSKPNMRERLYQWSVKVGAPVNRLTNKLGSEAFWPSSLDLESDKAARILTSFCHDGFYTDAPPAAAAPAADSTHSSAGAAVPAGPKGRPQKSFVKIPPEAIRQAAGLAIFTTFRTGLHISGAGGSGVVVARLPDGGWSPPSGFLVHTLGAGLLVGLDIYDCVCVLRTPQAVEAFTKARVSLGGEVGLVAGPVGAGGSVEAAVLAKSASKSPIWSYMKSRGFYAGVQADGTIIVGRPDANSEFYGQRGITVDQILRGQVPPPNYNNASGIPPWPVATRKLMEALKSAEGRTDVDSAVMREASSGPTPGDLGMADAEREVEVPQGEKDKAQHA